MATLTPTDRAARWSATLAQFLATGHVDGAPPAAPARRRATRTATVDDAAARHARWAATLASHLGPAAADMPADMTEPAADAPPADAAAFLEWLLAGVTPAPVPVSFVHPARTAGRPATPARPAPSARPCGRRRPPTAARPRRTPAPHVARDRAAAWWHAAQPKPGQLTPTVGRPWLPAAA